MSLPLPQAGGESAHKPAILVPHILRSGLRIFYFSHQGGNGGVMGCSVSSIPLIQASLVVL